MSSGAKRDNYCEMYRAIRGVWRPQFRAGVRELSCGYEIPIEGLPPLYWHIEFCLKEFLRKIHQESAKSLKKVTKVN